MVSVKDTYGLYLDGRFVEPASGTYFKTINPATEEVLAAVPEASSEDVAAAVAAARGGLEAWTSAGAPARGKYIFRIARIVQERSARACRTREHERR